MEIKRDNYLNQLVRKKNNGLIKIITGLRRSGKTYLLFNLFKNYLVNQGIPEDHIIEISFDSFEFLKFRDPNIFYNYVKSKIIDDDQYYILLDEVQLLDEFEAVLNGLSRLNNTDLYVTGSNARFLSKDIITEFRGRGDQVHISPLSFKEFMSVYSGDYFSGWNEYIRYGGLPQVVLLDNIQDKTIFLRNLINETYLNDIYSRHSIKNPVLFENVFDIIASDIGSLTNANKISRTFQSRLNDKVNYLTVRKYIEYLEDSFLVSRIKRFDLKGRHYINALEKVYFTDLGLRNVQLNFRQVEETPILENITYNELLIKGYNIDIGTIPRIIKDKEGKSKRENLEVDFICTRGEEKIYIQVALDVSDEKKLNQELRPLLKIKDSFKKVLITKSNGVSYYNEDGIHIVNLFDFLLNDII